MDAEALLGPLPEDWKRAFVYVTLPKSGTPLLLKKQRGNYKPRIRDWAHCPQAGGSGIMSLKNFGIGMCMFTLEKVMSKLLQTLERLPKS